jgi:hypothetical protein
MFCARCGLLMRVFYGSSFSRSYRRHCRGGDIVGGWRCVFCIAGADEDFPQCRADMRRSVPPLFEAAGTPRSNRVRRFKMHHAVTAQRPKGPIADLFSLAHNLPSV